MAQSLRILGQAALALADTEEQLYKVPSGYETVVSTIAVCNRTSSAQTFRIGLDAGDDNAGDSEDKDHLYFDTAVPPNDTHMATIGVTIGPEDSINVQGSHADLTFQAFGREIPL